MTRTAYASLLSRSLLTYHTACLVCHLYSSVYCLWTMKTKDRVLCTSTPSLIPVAHILYHPPLLPLSCRFSLLSLVVAVLDSPLVTTVLSVTNLIFFGRSGGSRGGGEKWSTGRGGVLVNVTFTSYDSLLVCIR